MVEHYELLTIFPGNLTDEEIQAPVNKLQELIKQHGAIIAKHDFWGKRKLAYEIAHLRHGFYDLTDFDLETKDLAKLDAALRLSDEVLRHQIVKRTVKTEAQLAAEQALREHIAAKRQAAREKEPIAATPESAPTTEPVTGPVETQKLDEKLEEILDTDKIDL
jgi:small subunit ribosomal protein S6